MSAHLTDEQLFEIAAGEAESEHTASCERCAAELRSVKAALAFGQASPAPDELATARMRRGLDALLVAEVSQQRRAWRGSRVVLVAAVAALSGAAIAFSVSRIERQAAPVSAPQVARSVPVEAEVEPSEEELPELELPELEPEPEVRRSRRPDRPRPAASEMLAVRLKACDVEWRQVASERGERGEFDSALAALVNGLCGAEAHRAADDIEAMVRQGQAATEAVEARIDATDTARETVDGMGLLCSLGLRYRPGIASLDRCDAFFSAYPGDQAVRDLTLAAGVVAERNGLEDRALASYSRLITVGSGGVGSSPALFRRAKLRMSRGEREAARGDLSLYLAAQPEAWQRGSVRKLAKELGLQRSP